MLMRASHATATTCNSLNGAGYVNCGDWGLTADLFN